MTLYELTDEMRSLLDLLEQESDETEQEAIKAALECTVFDIAEKAEGYGQVIRQIEADAAAVKAEKMRLAKKQSSLENNAARLREALKNAMIFTGQPKIKTKLFTFSMTTRENAVLDFPVDQIPMDFWKVKDPEADMRAVEKALKDGELQGCKWAHLEKVESMTIR